MIEKGKVIVEKDWINLYDSIEPLDRPLCTIPQRKREYLMHKEDINYIQYQKEYQQTKKYKEYKKKYNKHHRINKKLIFNLTLKNKNE